MRDPNRIDPLVDKVAEAWKKYPETPHGWWECPCCGMKYREKEANQFDKCPNCGLELTEDIEEGKPRALTYTEVLQLKNEPVVISHTEKGTWEDEAQPVQSFMDMNHLPLKSGVKLDLDDYGIIWSAHLKGDKA